MCHRTWLYSGTYCENHAIFHVPVAQGRRAQTTLVLTQARRCRGGGATGHFPRRPEVRCLSFLVPAHSSSRSNPINSAVFTDRAVIAGPAVGRLAFS